VQGTIVHLSNIQVRTKRGEELFSGLNFMLQSERSAVIIGGAGSGKSTLFELLLGMQRPMSGTIELFGEQFQRPSGRQLRRIRRKIGGVGGPFALVPSLTVAENIQMPQIIAGERAEHQKERMLKLLGEFSLLNHAGQYPASLTRVEQMLVQIARASIAYQPLMIIDEPSAGLDSRTYARVFEYLIQASQSGRSLIILSSEKPPMEIPNSDTYAISGGMLA
jgi:ABC-type lipoprotein export system ATPase subunit